MDVLPQRTDSLDGDTWWSRPSGVREVLRIALPMVASMLSWTMMSFIDSSILYHVSGQAMSAAFSASVMWFAGMSLFWGVCSYSSTFVSQYHGDGQPERIGPAAWQGVWLGLAFFPLGLAAMALAPHFFALHEPSLAALETEFFRVLWWGAPGMLAAQSLEGFFSGRGRTWVVMLVDAGAVLVNLILACVLVLGLGGIEPWGMRGAAWATVAAQWSRALLFTAVMWSPANRREFNTLAGMRPDASLLARMVRYGGPSGVQMLLDVGGFTVFVMLIGRLGLVETEATSMVFRVSQVAFMPVWGLGLATVVLVGHRLGEDRPELATRAAHTTLAIALVYMGLMSLLFVATPGVFLQSFFMEHGGGRATDDAGVRRLTIHLLRFVAAYNLFDALVIIFVSVLRGAGDTRFIMRVSFGMAAALMGGTWLGVDAFGWGVYACWVFITLWVWALGIIYFARFRQGRWRSMRVIDQVHGTPGELGEAPPALAIAE